MKTERTKHRFGMVNIKTVRRLKTHCSRETPKRVIDKQYRPRSDATERDVWSGSSLFVNSLTICLEEFLNLMAWPT